MCPIFAFKPHIARVEILKSIIKTGIKTIKIAIFVS